MTGRALPIVFFATALASVSAQSVVLLTSKGCANPSGFESCQAEATSAYNLCTDNADKDHDDKEKDVCGCVNYTDNYNCYATHCWNKVYECTYQEYVVDYLSNCVTGRLPVPYFPIPDNTPDSCSCNVGQVYLNAMQSIIESITCLGSAGSIGGLDALKGCQCCELSGALTAIYSICPDTDPEAVGGAIIQEIEKQNGFTFDTCGSPMEQFPCGTFGFTNGSSFYEPSNVPAAGTDPLSNKPGAITSPLSGSVFTYTNGGNGLLYTISAQGVGKAGNGGGSGGNGNGSGSRSGGGSSSQTEARTTATGNGRDTSATPVTRGGNAAETGSGSSTLASPIQSRPSAGSAFGMSRMLLVASSMAVVVFCMM
ncbi:hypothetical protein F5884DRAFT_884977 [Xylogone sp. PMI_703]|nr:hypothetical protein F5884DRAFT_884977 [Xylogone sp. PMI_703]